MLAERRPKVRVGLRALFEQAGGIRVVAEAVDAAELMEMLETCCPDLILLDWDLARKRSKEIVADLRRLCPGVGIIALSGEPKAGQEARAAGADAFVSKGDPPERLLEAMRGGPRPSRAHAERHEDG